MTTLEKHSREENILNWISQCSSTTITEAHQLTDLALLGTVIEALFNTRIDRQQEHIQDVINQIPNTGQSQFIYNNDDDLPALLDYIQTAYELHFVTYTILNNTQLTFTSFVSGVVSLIFSLLLKVLFIYLFISSMNLYPPPINKKRLILEIIYFHGHLSFWLTISTRPFYHLS